MSDVIVVGNAGIVNMLYQANANQMGPPSTKGQAMAIHFGGLQNVTTDKDVPEDVVVIGKKLHSAIFPIAGMQLNYSTPISLPCLNGTIGSDEIIAILNRLRFKITTKDFGPGRAGANDVTTSTGYITVEINDQWLKGYDLLNGGLEYIVAHEVGHSTAAVQKHYKVLWEQYVAGAGKDLSSSERIKQFPSSAEFAKNEALANSVGRSIMERAKSPALNFTPPHGYAC